MSGNILIVDDSKVMLKVLEKIILSKLPAYKVFAFSNPQEGLEKIKEQKLNFTFAFIDYNMNEMNGIDFARELFELDHGPVNKDNVSMLSANIQEAVKTKANQLGMDFIPKPLDEEKLTIFLREKGIE
jgi:two-component system, chemotaxis family, chemotaxis protein CheY